MSIHTTIKYGAAFDAALFKASAPGLSADDLCRLLGSKPDTVFAHLHALQDAGLCYVSGHTPTGARIYAWQPMACFMPDHVRELCSDTRARKRLLKRLQHERLGEAIVPKDEP